MSLKQSAGIETRLARAKAFAQAWREVDPNLGLDDLTLKNYDDSVADLDKAYMQLVTQETAIDNTRAQVSTLTNETDDNEIRLHALAKRSNLARIRCNLDNWVALAAASARKTKAAHPRIQINRPVTKSLSLNGSRPHPRRDFAQDAYTSV